ncbi:hypothetical protein [uncultured Corynebacterium sp.]|uniref:hypothetical protein n=1 Tax=uncultured Corynebacterium sp. TaxID=159447 RepID=UPI00259133EE|nr:hypothetical protein [uncultured Corynebacterium sp.]
MQDSDQPQQPRAFMRRTWWLVAGSMLLIIGLATGITALLGVNNFGAEDGVSVSANKSYYLLADRDALGVTECNLELADGSDANSLLSNVEPLVDESMQVQDVSLPVIEAKGVYARVQFSEDADNLRYVCDTGQTYISSFSETTLQALRWVSLLTLLFGIAALLAALALRYLPGRDSSTSAASPATSTTRSDPEHGQNG